MKHLICGDKLYDSLQKEKSKPSDIFFFIDFRVVNSWFEWFLIRTKVYTPNPFSNITLKFAELKRSATIWRKSAKKLLKFSMLTMSIICWKIHQGEIQQHFAESTKKNFGLKNKSILLQYLTPFHSHRFFFAKLLCASVGFLASTLWTQLFESN